MSRRVFKTIHETVALLAVSWIAQTLLAAQPASPVSTFLNAPVYERTLADHLVQFSTGRPILFGDQHGTGGLGSSILAIECAGLFSGDIVRLAWSPDGNFLAAKPENGAPCIYDARTSKPKAEWVFPEPASYHLAFAWDGSLLALLANGELHSLNAATLESLTGQDP